MTTDIKSIGIFGLSFSRGLDQTWFNLWHKDNGYSADFTQMIISVDDDDDDDDDAPQRYIETSEMISFEQGEELLRRAFEDGGIESWKPQYSANDEGVDTDMSWTLDVDDLEEQDIIFVSGNGKLPPREQMMGVIEAIRTVVPEFGKCFEELR